MPGQIVQGRGVTADRRLEVDFCIVGSGAGGGVCALKLAQAGFEVALLEEGPDVPREPGHGGPCHVRRTLEEREAKMYRRLYQEGASRLTNDFQFLVLQGRCLGGGTTVNWSACLPPPDSTLNFWNERFDLELSRDSLKPYLREVVNYLHIHRDDRFNQSALKMIQGCQALGLSFENLPNNTLCCRECGSCGTGCPYDRKLSGIVKWIPDALSLPASAGHVTVFTDIRVDRVRFSDRKATAVEGRFLHEKTEPTGGKLEVFPRRGLVLSAGAIGTPSILLRSQFPNLLVGRYTHIHPITMCFGLYEEPTFGAYGVPDNMMTADFAENDGHTGYLIETGSFFPQMMALASLDFGPMLRRFMRDYAARGAITYAHNNSGFDPDWDYGTVQLDGKGAPHLEYRLHPANRVGMKDSLVRMTRIHLAAGAESVYHITNPSIEVRSPDQIGLLDGVTFSPGKTSLLTVHVMGGSRIGGNPHNSVVAPDFRLRKSDNVWVVDGSLFPTGLGANPQVTIYSLALMAAKTICETHGASFQLEHQEPSTLWQLDTM